MNSILCSLEKLLRFLALPEFKFLFCNMASHYSMGELVGHRDSISNTFSVCLVLSQNFLIDCLYLWSLWSTKLQWKNVWCKAASAYEGRTIKSPREINWTGRPACLYDLKSFPPRYTRSLSFTRFHRQGTTLSISFAAGPFPMRGQPNV